MVPGGGGALRRVALLLLRVAVAAAFVGINLAIATSVTPGSTASRTAAVLFAVVAIWLFFSDRIALTLGVVVLYLGLIDGYAKLRTGLPIVTLGRDILLYSVVLGLLIRHAVRREPLPVPPLAALAFAFVAFTVVQVLNPGTGGIGHGLAALRPHLEFVPLFLLAFMTVTTKRRLVAFLVLLAFAGSINGVVSLIQFNLSPQELALWGPGYEQRIFGSGIVSGRTFVDGSGVSRVRPFGLTSDSGGGGLLALLTLPAALALLGLARTRAVALLAIPMLGGISLAIFTSQGRAVLIGAVLAAIAYVALTALSRRLVPTMAAIAAVGAIAFLTVSALTGDPRNEGAFSRYQTVAPRTLVETAGQERGGSLSLATSYAEQYPLGAGLGTVGPAAAYASAGKLAQGFNGETEFNFLLLELGVIGTLLFLACVVRLIGFAFARIRRLSDPDLRIMLAALAAPLVALLVMFTSGVPTSGSPGGAYLWGVGGILVYWLGPARRQTAAESSPA
jgi:hypothetical protein